jgi:hypothetical protein
MLNGIKSCRRILVVLHQAHSTVGRLERLLREQGFELDCRRPCFGDPMCINDEDAWLRREIEWIGIPLKEDTPFLGICLGAQMLARYLGRRVRPHPHGRVEVGYYPIQPTEQGHCICDCRFPNHVYQWHREGFDLPCGAKGGSGTTVGWRAGPGLFCAAGSPAAIPAHAPAGRTHRIRKKPRRINRVIHHKPENASLFCVSLVQLCFYARERACSEES